MIHFVNAEFLNTVSAELIFFPQSRLSIKLDFNFFRQKNQSLKRNQS